MALVQGLSRYDFLFLLLLLLLLPRQKDKKLVAKLWEAARRLGGCSVVWPSGLLWLPEVLATSFLIYHPPGPARQAGGPGGGH